MGKIYMPSPMAERQIRVVKLSINLPMDFPMDWDDDSISFYLNESSSCCDNRIEDLKKYSEKHGCICAITNCHLFPQRFDDMDSAVSYAMEESDKEYSNGVYSVPSPQ